MPKTKELDVALRNLVRTEGQNNIHWIGLRKKKGLKLLHKLWRWMDGVVLRNYKGWNPGRPNNYNMMYGYQRLCVSYFSGVTGYPMWDDTSCGFRYRFICQAPPV
ncbi:lithostathine-like [Branchiostoma floridae x Branchiostoma japonicum]